MFSKKGFRAPRIQRYSLTYLSLKLNLPNEKVIQGEDSTSRDLVIFLALWQFSFVMLNDLFHVMQVV